MKNQNKIRTCIVGAALVFILVLIDQLTKNWAVAHLKGQENIIWIKGVMELEYLENRGAAFGILQNQQWLFILLFFVIVVAIALLYWRMPEDKKYFPLRVLSLLIIAGGIGNLIDRIFLGYVVDFFYFSLINFPIFNVADIYVTVSIFVLFALTIFYYKEEDFNRLFESVSFKRGRKR